MHNEDRCRVISVAQRTGTAEGEYPQIRLTIMPHYMNYSAARNILRREQGRNLYAAVAINRELRHILYGRLISALPPSLDDSELLNCLGDHAQAFMEKLYWLQVFVGATGETPCRA